VRGKGYRFTSPDDVVLPFARKPRRVEIVPRFAPTGVGAAEPAEPLRDGCYVAASGACRIACRKDIVHAAAVRRYAIVTPPG